MAEDTFGQILLGSSAKSAEGAKVPNIRERLVTVVNNARDKHRYYKMPSNGMWEQLDYVPPSEQYDILALKGYQDKNQLGFYFDNQLCVKFDLGKGLVSTTQELYSALLEGHPYTSAKSAPKGGCRVELGEDEAVDFFEQAVEYLVKIKCPAHKFSCCNLYKDCSAAKHCLHPHPFYAKGCQYRANLDVGDIFY